MPTAPLVLLSTLQFPICFGAADLRGGGTNVLPWSTMLAWSAAPAHAMVALPAGGFLASIAMLPQNGSITMQIDRLLVSKKELKSLGIPYSFQHIARLEKAGCFPKRVQLGPCRVAWRYEEVCNWIDERVVQRDPGRPLG